MLTETEDRLGEGGEPHVVDASLISAGKRLEHWEIASYGAMVTYARAMSLPAVADLLEKTLGEEQAMDDRLSAIAKEVNVEDRNSTQQSNQSSSKPLSRVYIRKEAWQRRIEQRALQGEFMFLIIGIVLVVAWLGGFLVFHTASLLIHLLLLFAVISIVFHFLRGARA